MTQRVTFLVAFDLPATVDREVARKALKETLEGVGVDVNGTAIWNPKTISVVHHPTVRRD